MTPLGQPFGRPVPNWAPLRLIYSAFASMRRTSKSPPPFIGQRAVTGSKREGRDRPRRSHWLSERTRRSRTKDQAEKSKYCKLLMRRQHGGSLASATGESASVRLQSGRLWRAIMDENGGLRGCPGYAWDACASAPPCYFHSGRKRGRSTDFYPMGSCARGSLNPVRAKPSPESRLLFEEAST